MRKDHSILVLVSLFFLVGCLLSCGSVPETYYYRIDYEMAPVNSTNDTVPVTLGVSQFNADILYEGDRIVYRKSPYEVQYYHYRRWIAPPKKLVTERVIKQMKESGLFQRVVKIPSVEKIDYILTGKIQSFEELDEGNDWYGVVALELNLHDTESQEIVWEGIITERTAAQEKKPVEVVKAISQSLNRVIRKSISDIHKKLKAEHI